MAKSKEECCCCNCTWVGNINEANDYGKACPLCGFAIIMVKEKDTKPKHGNSIPFNLESKNA